jgi:hypothetical protein
MDEVRNPINSVCYTPSSEPYRIFKECILLCLHILLFFILILIIVVLWHNEERYNLYSLNLLFDGAVSEI